LSIAAKSSRVGIAVVAIEKGLPSLLCCAGQGLSPPVF
jgi:hypothetical protein